jgi:hypothetical protein
VEAARLIAARLLREGAVLRSEIEDLDHPEVRREVEKRLEAAGLTLASSAYSEYVGIRISPDIAGDRAFDAASNLGLRADACALLVVLWARLVMQKRTATDSRQTPGDSRLFAADAAEAARNFVPSVRFEALAREFQDVFGSRSHLKRLVTQLRRLKFAAGRGEVIEAGPLLELGIDGEAMVAFIRRGVLSRLTEQPPERGKEELPPTTEEKVLAAVAEEAGDSPISLIEEKTGIPRPKLRAILNLLREDGRIERVGERATTRYRPGPNFGTDPGEGE